MKKIAIIGAGLAGLTAAHFLRQKADITIFEKSRGVSGRLSTRRAEPYHFDHGAQYFSARTDQFKDFIQPLIHSGVIEPWNARFVDISNREISSVKSGDDHDSYYIGVPGMNAIGKYLSRDLDVRLGGRIDSIFKNENSWVLLDEHNQEFGGFDWVIAATPANQAVEILPSCFQELQSLKNIIMKGCFSLMLGFEQPLALNFDAARVHGEDIGWIAVNNSKPRRADAYSLLVHSTNDWADKHMDDEHDKVMTYLCDITSELIGYDVSTAQHKALHGWRYANADKRKGQTHFIDHGGQLGACGDWCIEGRVEAAFTSASSLANEMLEVL